MVEPVFSYVQTFQGTHIAFCTLGTLHASLCVHCFLWRSPSLVVRSFVRLALSRRFVSCLARFRLRSSFVRFRARVVHRLHCTLKSMDCRRPSCQKTFAGV